MQRAIIILLLTFITGCSFALPYRDSGNHQEARVVAVGLTHAVLGDDSELRSKFWDYSGQVIDSLESQPGYIGHSLRFSISGREVWTMTVWSSEQALNDFVDSDIHMTAINEGVSALEEGSFARVLLPRSEVPLDWAEAQRLLEESPRKY